MPKSNLNRLHLLPNLTPTAAAPRFAGLTRHLPLAALSALALIPALSSAAEAAQNGRLEQVQLLVDATAPAGLQLVVTTRAAEEPIASVSIQSKDLHAPVCTEAGKPTAASQRFVCPVVSTSAGAPFAIQASADVLVWKGNKQPKPVYKKADTLSVRLASPMRDGLAGVPGLPADDDPLTVVYLREVKELADILKNEYGIEPAAAAGLVVSSQGWTLGQDLPVLAEWALDDGTVLQLPRSNLQVTGSVAVAFDGDPTGQPFTVVVDGQTRVDLIAGSGRGQCQFGRCFCLVKQGNGWALQASAVAGSEAELPQISKLEVRSYSQLTPKLASAELRFGQRVHVFFDAAVALTELPAGQVLDGKLKLLGAPNAKGKRTAYASGRVRGVVGSADQPGVQFGSADGKGEASAASLFGAVLAINSTKEKDSVPLGTVLETSEVSGVAMENPTYAPGASPLTNQLAARTVGDGRPQTDVVILRRNSTFRLQLESPAQEGQATPLAPERLLLTAATGPNRALTLQVDAKVVSGPVQAKTADGQLVWQTEVEGALPAELPAGSWTLRGYGKTGYDSAFVMGETNALVQFNAADPKAPEFVADEVERFGLVEAQTGLLPIPTEKAGGFPWAYNQFDFKTLQIAAELTDALPLDARRSPEAVMQALVAGVSNNILRGRWDEDYKDGKEPGSWSSSSEILGQWGKKPKYGQCWVFSAVTTSLARSLGIPATSMTNFNSAHEKARTAQPGPNACAVYADGAMSKSTDGSVWNFHVWVEARTSGGNWNAYDATPQESSSGPDQGGSGREKLWGFHVWNGLAWQPGVEPVKAAPWSYVATKPGLEAAEALAADWTVALQSAVGALYKGCGTGNGYSRLCQSNVARLYSKPGS